ncbi:glycerophosphodiester phosphodiesterase [Paenibacillus sp. UNC451MF]|uniref:glycerophosphodiester phosphodiesterase n=1 Tax=Paenibacillus sp. UNC451MF TaxID=1449063 RepID=UPI00048D1C74|nr:glycerophosphodiester phosphodiesterase [Paenibacillus sp. UNC451MF]
MTQRPFPRIGAHTGCDNTPYNTVESFREGIRLGADIVEVDIRITREGTLVLLHDDSSYLHEYTYEQLNQQSVRSRISPLYERLEIVKLTDILDIAKEHSIKLNLDIKTSAAIEPVVELIQRRHCVEQVFITGCSENITSRHKDIKVVLNTPTKLTEEEKSNYALYIDKVCRDGEEGHYYGLNMHHETCRPELVEAAHKRGLAVWVYTVNDPDRMRRCIQSGVDAITTKEVAILSELRRRSLLP